MQISSSQLNKSPPSTRLVKLRRKETPLIIWWMKPKKTNQQEFSLKASNQRRTSLMDHFSRRVGHTRVNLATSKRVVGTKEIIIAIITAITKEVIRIINLMQRQRLTHLTMQMKTPSGTILTLRNKPETSLAERSLKKSS